MWRRRFTIPSPLRSAVVFGVVAAVALGFALYTRHAWEDYYITFRSSRNLATGHGLFFNWGDRLHTFTSPLGVLLPALASAVTLNRSDAAALWLFRAMSVTALATGVALLFSATQRRAYALVASVFLALWLALDTKIVDFSINGMETGLLLLFLAYGWWALLRNAPDRWRHLGCAWGGLLWTRPDAFIYIGAIAGGMLLFNRNADTQLTRRQWLAVLVKAGALAAAIYLPWLLFATWYYGSPVPHTIVAKATAAGPRSLAGLWHFLPEFPRTIWQADHAFAALFSPAYLIFGGWPESLVAYGRFIAATASVIWLIPGLRTETRAASFAFALVSLYLTYYPPFLFPWYLCAPACLAIFALSGAFSQLWLLAKRVHPAVGRLAQTVLAAAAIAIVIGAGWFTTQAARQLEAQQRLIENGTRRAIGEWLHDHSRPGDTVMLEPLGYIGYFSDLRTFDMPGLSSREVVSSIRRHGFDWGAVARELRPTWLVLRPYEISAIAGTQPTLLASDYTLVREFDHGADVQKLPIHGRNYLVFDSRFVVFHRKPYPPAE